MESTINEKLRKLKQEMATECVEDHLGLWFILGRVKMLFPKESPVGHRRLTLTIVSEILDDTNIKAGFPAPGGRDFSPWDMPKADVLAKINQQWDALDGEPTIGDIVWFTAME